MKTKKLPPNPGALFKAVVKNGIDFLKTSADELPKRPKYSAIHFASALELFVKARLMREHWSLIVDRPGSADLSNFVEGNFISVTLDDALARLSKIAGEDFTAEKPVFGYVRTHRNKLIHFFDRQYAESDTKAIEEVVAEQCRAWYHLQRLLTDRWREHFSGFISTIEKIDEQMRSHRSYLQVKYTELKPRLTAFGNAIVQCESCGYDAARLELHDPPLRRVHCLVCGKVRACLHVTCPHCDKETDLDDGEATCSECHNEVGIDWLLDTFSPDRDPKEDSVVAYCPVCEYADRPTAIPLEDGGYLCLLCMVDHNRASHCNYCGELVADLGSADSAVFGCMLCHDAVTAKLERE